MAAVRLLDKTVFRQKTFRNAAAWRGRLITQNQSLQITGNQVHLKVHNPAGVLFVHDSFF